MASTTITDASREPWWAAGRAVWLAACLLPAAGCGGGPDLPDRAKVTGVVTLDGQPLKRGEVMFVPDKSKNTQGPAAFGIIGADGRYQLSTDHSGNDGAIVGWHLVRVSSREDVEPGEPSQSLIPEHYGYIYRSGLAAEVKSGIENVIDLPLQSAQR